MGTRNLTMVMVDGAYKVAQYGQWDGYPSGQGITVFLFLKTLDETKKKKFIEKCKALVVATDENIQDAWVKAGAEKGSNFVTMDVDKKMSELYPHLNRNCGAKVLDIINKSKKGLLVQLDANFVNDSLFCEWCYVIDFDKNTFEVYEGFNKKKLPKKARFYNRELNEKAGKEDVYTPVKLKKSWSLDNLPKDDAEFYKDLKWKY